MKIILISLLFSLQTVHGATFSEWKKATIKLISYPCLTEAPRFEGSGLLFKKDHQLYIVTSEHVLIHNKSASVCHYLGQSKLELIKADFFSGMALLKVKNPNVLLESSAIGWEEMALSGANQNLMALGFPVGSSHLLSLENGNYLSSESQRSLIAGVSRMIETSNIPVEYGMSGGVLLGLENENTYWIGLLSHQVLRRIAGRPTLPDSIDKAPANLNDIALSIPKDEVISWINQQLTLKTQESWQRNAALQIEGVDAIEFGALLFKMQNVRGQDIWGIGGMIHGGSDGSGIGGDDNSQSSNERLQTIEVSFIPGINSTMRSQSLGNANLENWKQWLLNGKKVSIVFLKNSDSKKLVKIQSLSQFLTLWMRDEYTPVAIRSKDITSTLDSDILISRCGKVALAAQKAIDQVQSIDKKAWLTMIRNQAVLAQTALTSADDLRELKSGQNDFYWRELYNENFDIAVELEAALQSLIEQMNKMGL